MLYAACAPKYMLQAADVLLSRCKDGLQIGRYQCQRGFEVIWRISHHDAHAYKEVRVQAQVLLKELAAVVEAETANAMSDYVLLKDMNRVVEAKYDGMLKHVESLQPVLTVTFST